MKITGLLAAVAMIGATTAPAVAAPRAAVQTTNAASKLSIARAATPTRNGSKLAGESPAVSVLIAAVALGGLLALNSALGDEDPVADSN